jgi:penicillin amidase
MNLGSSVRRIVDFSDLSSTRSILPTGQSGNPISDHYGDQTSMWLNQQYRIFYQKDDIENKSNYKTMKLISSETN